MDGRGRASDNIFIERLWRTVKYEEVKELAGKRFFCASINRDSSAPGRAKKFSGAAYTFDEVERMLEEIKDETTCDVIALLSITGLR